MLTGSQKALACPPGVSVIPIFDILGTEYRSKNISSLIDKNGNDQFTKVDFASYVNSKLNENGMNPVTEKELLENRIDFNEHKIPHVEFVEFPEEMRSQYLLYAFPTMLKMAYEYCFITFGEKYLKNPIAMNIRDFLIKYDYKKDTEYCSPTIASLMWISEEERKISLKMYIDNDNIWVQIVLWGMILANICMLEEVFEDEMKIDSGLSVEM